MKKNATLIAFAILGIILIYGMYRVLSVSTKLPKDSGEDLAQAISELEQRSETKEKIQEIHQNDELDDAAKAIIVNILLQEYYSEAAYNEIEKVYGEIKPFSDFNSAQSRNSDELVSLLSVNEAEIPVNEYANGENIEDFNSLSEACAIVLASEQGKVVIYTEGIESIDNENVSKLLADNLHDIENNRIPALLYCSDDTE